MVELESVSFHYGREDAGMLLTGVEDISFKIEQGQCAVLCGRSGAGKSTSLHLISGLVPGFYEGQLKGRVIVNNGFPSSFTPEERVATLGVVFQDPRSQFFMGKVLDEIAFSAENIGLSPERILPQVMECAKRLEIESLLEKKVNELSSGQKQRVAIAAATVFAPPVLILDEPISNLDRGGIKILLEILGEIKQNGTTIIISEHRLHQFLSIADVYLHIDAGRLVNKWTKAQFERLTCSDLIEWGIRHPDLAEYVQRPHRQILSADKDLTVEGISFRYKKAVWGIEDLSCCFPAGTVTAILGRNGIGKTTFCKILCGLLKQKVGTIKRENQVLSCAERRASSYLVMQDADYQIYADSVGNELVLGKKVTEDLRNRAYDALDAFHLTALKDRHPASLSGGEKQRVTIAAAYCSDADIIILDEPTSGMDGEGVLSLSKWVTFLAQKGKTIIIITHDDLLCDMACDNRFYMGGKENE